MESSVNKYSRKSKEAEKVDLFFASVVNRFHEVLFMVDYDDPKTPDADVFGIFNRAWVSFCTEWNKKAKHHAANPMAFEDYAIKQDLE